MFYQQMLERYKKLEEEIQKIECQMAELPEGTFFYIHNGKYAKWYRYMDGKQIYIPKNERDLAESLSWKKYLSLRLQELTDEKEAIEAYLKNKKFLEPVSTELFADQEYKKLLEKKFQPVSTELSDWANASYEKNSNYPEQLIHKTSSGNIVRSKSEALIDYCLYMNKIPFRYECALKLGTKVIHPEFTIRHPKTGKTYYWEHFGMMDVPSYCNNAYSRLKLYSAHGIVPFVQLITTFEIPSEPLSSDLVEKIVKHYFL